MDLNVMNLEGKKYAVIPLQQYEKMTMKLKSFKDIQQAILIQNQIKTGEMQTYPSSVVESIIAGEHPVKAFREHYKLTQAELAEKIGKSPAIIRKIEAGESEGSISTMKAISKALNVDLDVLVN